MEQEILFDEHDNEQSERYKAAKKSTWVSVFVNCLLTVGQVFVGILSGSQGLIADGIHSLSDLVADFVVLLANYKSKKEADEDHPYGHHRYENAASLVLGALLLAVGVGMLWSAIHKIQHPASRIHSTRSNHCALGRSYGSNIQRIIIPLHAGSCQTCQIQHAGS